MKRFIPQKGVIHLAILITSIIVLVVGASVAVLGSPREREPVRRFGYLCRLLPDSALCKASPKPRPLPSPKEFSRPTPTPDTTPTPTPFPSPSPSPKDLLPKTYTHPSGKYKITIPGGWVVNNTSATTTYSTTKFTGPNGFVSITFGTGKDPIGGCSETTNVELADRTIAGCFLLQKDGSQILTRAYTKDKAGIDFTIEAYMNPPLSYHRPVVLSVIKTIDIE